jgi:hypothetical protein
MLFALACSYSGETMRSFLATMYQEGFFSQQREVELWP